MGMATEAEWVARVESWRASGASARDFCKGKDYPARGLQWWASRLRKRAALVSERPKPVVALAQIVRRSPAQCEATARSIVVEFDGARVEVGEGADRALLLVVFEVLRNGRAEVRP